MKSQFVNTPKGLGDVIHAGITAVTRTVDHVARTKLTTRANNCLPCGKKIKELNKLFPFS
jgi:hypothetical protein